MIKYFKKINQESKLITNDLNNYKMLDIVKFIAAIMVVCIHCSQVFPDDSINFFIKNIVCRIAVPFFFITSAYFIRRGSYKNTQYINQYLKSTGQSYLFWSLIFIPIGLDWIYQNIEIAGSLLPFALLYGVLHIGTYYHLWYIPALLFSVFIINWLLKHISYKILFIISTMLFIFGSIETYYGLLPMGIFKDIFDILINIIFTTRSGLFYGMIFVLIGFFIFDYQDKLKSILPYVPMMTILSIVILICEGFFLYNTRYLDMNFLLGLIPFGFFFFLWMLSFPYQPKNDTKKWRELSKYYYFIHPVCIVIIEQIGIAYHFELFSYGIVSFMFIVVLTHILSLMIIHIYKSLTTMRIFLSLVGGLTLAFFMASIFFFSKNNAIIKFEFVPCLWFLSTLLLLYLLSRKHNGTKQLE